MADRSSRLIVLIAGLTMVPAFVAINALGPPLGTPTYLLIVAVACGGYIAAISSMLVTRHPPAGSFLVVCLLLAGVFRLPLLLTEPGADVFRYLWDAQVQRADFNPYIVVPSDRALAALHTDETRGINNPDLPTPYPPGAQRFFRLVFLFSDRAYAFKIALALCDLAVGFVLWRWLIATGAAPGWVIAYAWNPLVILVTAGEGHVDILGALWLMASVLFLTNGRGLSSMVCFVMAIAVKPLPIVLLPLYWRRVRLHHAALAALLGLLLYLPHVTDGRLPIGSLGVFVDQFRFNQTAFNVTSAIFGAPGAAGLAVAAGLTVAAVLRFRLPVTSAASWAWPMAAALVMSPVVYPWYLVWLAPFFVSVAALPLLVWSVSVLATYVVWHLKEVGQPWAVPNAVLLFEFGTVIAAGVWVVLKGRTPEPRNETVGLAADRRHEAAALKLSVLIPTHEEELVIGETLARARTVLGDQELIVVDGGSSDRTAEIASRHAKLVASRKTRGAALNDAAANATGNVLLFLHADTLLPVGAMEAIQRALSDPRVVGGAFRFSFDDDGWGARAIAIWVNARSTLMNVFLGDQAMFVRREVFTRAGGFRDWSVMEDMEILGRLRRFGRLQVISPPIVTSARRHRQRGWLKTMATIWLLTWLNLFGIPGPALARLYKPQR